MTVRRRRRAALLAISATIAAFALAGALRLNPACLFEPDEPDYLFTSRGLATLAGYVEIDHPDRPPHAFRPPGLPALLVPLSAVRPYDVVGAKVVVLGATLGFLVVLALFARRVAGAGSAAAVVALTAASPNALLHATEVVTEPPFLLASVAALWLVGRDPRAADRRVVVAVGLVLAALPFLRTIGVALTAACLLWGLSARERRRWAVTAALSLGPTILWSWRNAATGEPTYLASIVAGVRADGVGGTLARSAQAAWFYLARLPDLALTGLGRHAPVHDRVLVAPSPTLGAPDGVLALAGALLLIAAGAGAWRRRRQLGLAALYVLASLAALSIYPPRHERLAWPLVPLLWVGSAALVAGRPALRGAAGRIAAAALVVAAVGWLALPSARMVATNVAWRVDPAAFHREAMPPSYFADWRGAGARLAAASAAHDRVLTRHSDLGFAARRWQDSVRFEEVSPAEWRGRLAALGARFVAVPTTECGLGIRWYEFPGDPVFDWREVATSPGVALLEALPNRTGVAGDDDTWRPRFIERCRAVVERAPERSAARRRLAELLAEDGRGEEALRVLADPAAGDSAGIALSRGRVLLALDRPREALAAASRAEGASGAARLAGSIERLRRAAAAALELEALPAVERARRLAADARRALTLLDVGAARRALERAERLAPGDPAVLAARADWLDRTGRRAAARDAFRRLAALGDPAAADRLRMDALLEAAPAPDAVETVRLAEALAASGRPGRALALLERAAEAAPGDPAVEGMLGEAWLFYARPALAAAAFERALAARPGDPTALAGLERVGERLRPARW